MLVQLFTVNGELNVRDVLGLEEDSVLTELRVFEPPQEALLGEPAPPAPEQGQPLFPDMLPDFDLDQQLSEVPEIEEVLPEGRVYRSDLDPRVLVLEEIPESSIAEGPVYRRSASSWIVDTRGETAAVVVIGRRERGVVLWGKGGEIRIYSVSPR